MDGVRRYYSPHPEKHYVWFGDPAEGLEHGDDSAICWLCCEDGVQVAEYVGKLGGMELGELAYDMGEYYGWAYGCFENNKDQTPNNKLVEMRYPALHYQQQLGQQAGPIDTKKPGWNTNTLTRNWMVRHGIAWTADGSIKPMSRPLFDQMEVFAQNARGKFEAIPGGRDDAVFAYLGVLQMWSVWMKRKEHDNLAPMVAGKVVDESFLGMDLLTEAEPRTREARLGDRALERLQLEQADVEMEAMVW